MPTRKAHSLVVLREGIPHPPFWRGWKRSSSCQLWSVFRANKCLDSLSQGTIDFFREVLEVLRMRHQRSLEVPVAPPKSAQAQALDDDDDEDDVL